MAFSASPSHNCVLEDLAMGLSDDDHGGLAVSGQAAASASANKTRLVGLLMHILIDQAPFCLYGWITRALIDPEPMAMQHAALTDVIG